MRAALGWADANLDAKEVRCIIDPGNDASERVSAKLGFSRIGDSDALIVRGLIAILHALYSGLSVADVLATDAHAELARLGLDEHLSQQRSNGLRAMVERIRALAAEAAAE